MLVLLLHNVCMQDVVGDGNVGVAQSVTQRLKYKDTHETAAKATIFWVTQGWQITAGQGWCR